MNKYQSKLIEGTFISLGVSIVIGIISDSLLLMFLAFILNMWLVGISAMLINIRDLLEEGGKKR